MQNQTGLVKGLGLYGATSVVAGTMIGTAIFVVPSIMLAHVGTPSRVIAVWAFAGILSMFGALGYAELGAALPQAGGEYVYLHRAYGPAMGFLYGWTHFVVAKAASIAAISTGFLLYLAYFFPSLSGVLWQAPLPLTGNNVTLKLTGLQIGATSLILLLSILNVLGVRRSGAVQTILRLPNFWSWPCSSRSVSRWVTARLQTGASPPRHAPASPLASRWPPFQRCGPTMGGTTSAWWPVRSRTRSATCRRRSSSDQVSCWRFIYSLMPLTSTFLLPHRSLPPTGWQQKRRKDSSVVVAQP